MFASCDVILDGRRHGVSDGFVAANLPGALALSPVEGRCDRSPIRKSAGLCVVISWSERGLSAALASDCFDDPYAASTTFSVPQL